MKQAALFVMLSLVLSACVSTKTSPYGQKKDLAKAEQTYIQIGYEYFEKGRTQEAKKALVKALDLNSKSAGAHLGLARVYERELEYDLADDHFQYALRYERTTEIQFQYGVYQYNRGELKKAYRLFDKVLDDTLYVRRALAFEYQAIVSTRLERQEEAKSHYRKALALNTIMPNSHLGLARLYKMEGDTVTAYQHYQGFVGLVRAQLVRHSPATLWLGIQLADSNNDTNAIASFSLQLRNRFKDSPEYQEFLAWQQERQSS